MNHCRLGLLHVEHRLDYVDRIKQLISSRASVAGARLEPRLRKEIVIQAIQTRRLEDEIAQLPIAEQRGLVQRILDRLRSCQASAVDGTLLEAMAADPQIQAENRAIAREFAPTESDGLDSTDR